MKTLLIGEIHPEAKRRLEEKGETIEISDKEFKKGKDFSDIGAAVLRTFTKLGKRELKKLPSLKYVVSCSVGLDNLNLDELKKKGIEAIYCPGTNANSVAEHTLFLIISLLRKKKPLMELKGKTVSIIGLGAIGKAVAEKLSGWGVKTIAFDVIEQEPAFLEKAKVEMKTFEEVIKKGDIITLHVPLNEQTKGLVGEEEFKMMKEKIIFINTCRAEVVEEEALLKYFKEGKFKGIGLDVYSKKLKRELKRESKSRLIGGSKGEERVILTNHLGAQGEDSFREMCLKPVEIFLEKVNHEEDTKSEGNIKQEDNKI